MQSEMTLPLMKPVSAAWPEAFDHESAHRVSPLVPRLAARVSCCRPCRTLLGTWLCRNLIKKPWAYNPK